MAITAPVVDGKINAKYTDSSAKKENTGGSQMGYDQFLNLLCAEMQYQDPLEPTTNTDYVAQMATFSQLEATLSMKDSLTESASANESSVANSLVGKNVAVVDPESETGYTTGKVDYVMYEEGEIYLSIENKLYNLSSLDTVANDTYYEAVVQARTINSMLKDLPEFKDITASYKTAVEQIRALYDGLDDYQKGFVSKDDVETLERYESKIAELVEAEGNTEG